MASYTNWFILKTLLVSSLNGEEPNAQPPMASKICKHMVSRFKMSDILDLNSIGESELK